MKKLLVGFGVVASLFLGLIVVSANTLVNAISTPVSADTSAYEQFKTMEEMLQKRVKMPVVLGDTTNTYVVTDVQGDEVNGVAIDNITSENAGVVLSKNIDRIDVSEGDVVRVTFRQGALDDIKSVEVVDNDVLTEEEISKYPSKVDNLKGGFLLLTEDGTYVPESFYN